MLSITAKKVIEAYGGTEVWNNSKYLEAEVSVKGLAFTLKRRPFLEHAKIKIGKLFSKLTPIGKNKNITSVIAGRKNARYYFSFGRRLFYWDDLDLAYFSNYTFWNYFTFPRLLMNENIIWTEKEPGLLEGIFPDSIPTHNKIQQFHIYMESKKMPKNEKPLKDTVFKSFLFCGEDRCFLQNISARFA